MMGMPYVGCDTGGFAGGNSPDELLTRWYQAAAFMGIMRVHSTEADTPHFPYLYSKDAQDAMRDALNIRYQMIPMIYSLAHEGFSNGMPMTRPLFMEFPNDAKVQTLGDQWLVGTGLMVAPVLAQGGQRSVYFPAGATWFELGSNKAHDGGSSLSNTWQLNEI